jgi:hypothetical protein
MNFGLRLQDQYHKCVYSLLNTIFSSLSLSLFIFLKKSQSNGFVDLFSEILSEDESFQHRALASLVASKVRSRQINFFSQTGLILFLLLGLLSFGRV